MSKIGLCVLFFLFLCRLFLTTIIFKYIILFITFLYTLFRCLIYYHVRIIFWTLTYTYIYLIYNIIVISINIFTFNTALYIILICQIVWMCIITISIIFTFTKTLLSSIIWIYTLMKYSLIERWVINFRNTSFYC